MSDIQRWDGMKGYVMAMTVNDAGGYVTYAYHVAAVAAAEQRVTERHNAEHEDDRLAAFQNGYDAATVKERQRSVLLIADAYGKALSAARDAVAAECIAHHGYTPGQTCPYCTDALAAIDALLKEKP